MTDSQAGIRKIEDTIRSLESLKEQGLLPVEEAEASIAALQDQVIKLAAKLDGDGAIAQGAAAKAVGQKGVMVEGNMTGDINTGVNIKAEKVEFIQKEVDKSLPFPEALRWYLANIIATHQHLRLQGIRAGSQPLSVALEKVYVSLTVIEGTTRR